MLFGAKIYSEMTYYSIYFQVVFCFVLLHCSNGLDAQSCARTPGYFANLGFDRTRSALSSTERKFVGVVLIELSDVRNLQSERTKLYQHPSWRSAGYVGAIATDQLGNSYILPKPTVNMENNPEEHMHTVYRIDSKTGILDSFVKLPIQFHRSLQNVFGLMGSYYDCETQTLFVSSVAGSNAQQQLGQVYAIDVNTRKTTQILDSTDILGLTLRKELTGDYRLYYGSARESILYSLPLDKNFIATAGPKMEIDINGIGPRGDDRVRKIRFQSDGSMIATGTPFFYNLTPAAINPESNYVFIQNKESGVWELYR